MGTDLGVNAAARPDQLKRAEDYKAYMNEAKAVGIPTISLDKLLGYLKTDSSDRTIPLGGRIRGGDFDIRPKNSPPTSPGSVSGIYQKRTPK